MPKAEKIYLYTVAFNEPQFVKLQHEQLKRHLEDKFVYCVVDNSSDFLAHLRIKRYCKKHDIGYKRIASNPYSGNNPSASHALALNSIFDLVRKDHAITYFGVIDHDIFPFADTKLLDKLVQQKAYGLKQRRGDHVYLWPGYMFFDKSVFNGDSIDCMPTPLGDTAINLSKYLAANTKFARHKYKKFFDHGSAQADGMSVIDDSWIHVINGSDWANIGINEKKQKLMDILAHPAQLK